MSTPTEPTEQAVPPEELRALLRVLRRLHDKGVNVTEACEEALERYCSPRMGSDAQRKSDEEACARWKGRLAEAMEDTGVAERLLKAVGAQLVAQGEEEEGQPTSTETHRRACYQHVEELEGLLSAHRYDPPHEAWQALSRQLAGTLLFARAYERPRHPTEQAEEEAL
jgi:hypothetical protein